MRKQQDARDALEDEMWARQRKSDERYEKTVMKYEEKVLEAEAKYEYDVQIKVVKVKHVFYEYMCNDCGTLFRSVIPPHIKEEAQYGSSIQALAMSLTNTVNAPMNKVSMFLEGITDGELSPCEGYVAKLQKRGAEGLREFRDDLRRLLITRDIVYWDNTVVMICTKRACFRFYGDEKIAYYTAHAHKDMAGIDNDNVLALLTAETKTMHDHNTVNYNEKFCFDNIECNQHLQRLCSRNPYSINEIFSPSPPP